MNNQSKVNRTTMVIEGNLNKICYLRRRPWAGVCNLLIQTNLVCMAPKVAGSKEFRHTGSGKYAGVHKRHQSLSMLYIGDATVSGLYPFSHSPPLHGNRTRVAFLRDTSCLLLLELATSSRSSLFTNRISHICNLPALCLPNQKLGFCFHRGQTFSYPLHRFLFSKFL
jgi:hypothetical protein